MLTLAGRGVILAGARRIGADVARRLAADGIHVAIAYRSSRAEADLLADDLRSAGVRAALVQADLADETSVERLVTEAAEVLGDLSFVVNLASDYPRTPLDRLDAVAWDKAMDTAKGSYLLAVHAARRMRRNPAPTRGHIVLFGDWAAGETPYVNYLPYLTAKASIHFLTRGLAAELAPHGILVNCIAPGPTARPHEISEAEWRQIIAAKTPLDRESSASDIAELIATLLKSETITGEVIRVDAGRHIAGPGIERRRHASP
ncbi:MAG: SDR family oxidoreductase [SAR202 cluster bacterium]|nr:SDR family oxidoreductase [SAR202 cluster bacterium]